MINAVPPGLIFIVGALLIPLFRNRTMKSVYLLILPIASFINLISIPEGSHFVVPFLEYDLTFARIDRLSLIFGYVFHLISLITIIYALHVKDNLQHVAGFVYGGAALGVTFAGDLFSLFIFWEMLTVGSVFLIWANRTKKSLDAGFRYALYHVIGGLILLAGILLHVHSTGSIEFSFIGLENGNLGSYLIFLGFGINCAWPLLHPWLTDAYPEATITGVIFLSAFTTKTAVYVLARAFPGTAILIWIGALMTMFPIFYAVIENDLRRVLAYSLINQVGFMVCGIGIGTELAVNGAVAHAFNDIIFKALLFMSVGAVMYRTGKVNATDLGGLYKSMPLTCIFCIVGAASISAFPLFSGFVSKSMVMSAASHGGMSIIWFMLLFASAGVFHHAGIKIPFFAFFSHDSGIRTKEAPPNMLIAMGIAAFLCIFIGTFPSLSVYPLLPYTVNYEPYTASHVMAQTQLLFFSALAFTLLLLSGIYPSEMRAINLDADWFYRKGSRLVIFIITGIASGIARFFDYLFIQRLPRILSAFSKNPISGLIQGYMKIDARSNPSSSYTKREAKPELVNIMPAGIPVLIAVIFLYLLAFIFIQWG
ncbi:MAG: Na(+)/H(+) antiporter subunit D [Deltaproteobacteria bacterium]|nr:Na(+)/H(+) antiporter subunit D [Deltaproteobacteria bacterium]MBN2845643.1 Na(+)/H(+) antiporter subunit D [Deltaproteobacteria bacterium]